MILLTGAAGKTGQAIIHALKKKNINVRVFVRTQEQSTLLQTLGADDVFVGDLHKPNELHMAVQGCESIYYICPNVSPDEVQIGLYLLEAARKVNIHWFVYHSVLHSQIEVMPHHWQKMRFEEQLFESGFNYTIFQPCAYMQNVLANWNAIIEEGVYAVPYSTSARISIVDLEDVAEVAVKVLTETTHYNSVYELAGPEPLSQDEVASILGSVLGIEVRAKVIDRQSWAKNARKGKSSDIQIETLLKMFEYYEKYGLVGNSNVLEMLLGRPAGTFHNFVKRQIPYSQEKNSGGNH